jgi:hypothetical protein
VVSFTVIVVSRIRAPGSSAALLDAHPAARVLTSPARSSRVMFTSQGLDCSLPALRLADTFRFLVTLQIAEEARTRGFAASAFAQCALFDGW